MTVFPRVRSAVVLALAATTVLAACSSGSPTPSASSASPSESSASPTTPPVHRSLLSGRAGATDGPVLAVKIDNTVNSDPHAGVMAADVVYLEQVEWGLTRILAVYSSEYPKEIGPIRSARIADLELLPQYGKVAFAFSGAQHKLWPYIDAAPLYDVSGDSGGVGYWRVPDRPAPYNFFGSPKQLLARAPHAQKPHDVGFTFSTARPPGGRVVQSFTATWPYADARFWWSAAQHRWLLRMYGRKWMATDGQQLGGTTVIVQYVNVYDSQFGDKFGGITPMTDTVGSGKALVFRNGRVWPVRWSRPDKSSGTTWTWHGKELAMAPGQVWVLLLDKTRPVTTVPAKG